jgi:hypothetical protein
MDRVTDDQQPTTASTNPDVPADAPPATSMAPTATEPQTTKRMSRRMVLLLAGIGVSGAAAIGAGAYSFYESQSAGQGDSTQTNPGGQMPGGYGSAMPRGNRSGMPSGARPSGVPSGGFSSRGRRGNASVRPTDQPT